jgi:two-component system phosphate regulon sensor histidine kinase PhoR
MTDGVIIVDREGGVSLVNPAASLLFNISEPLVLGKSLTETIRNHQIVDLWKLSREKDEQLSLSMELPANRSYIQVVCTPLGEAVQNATLILFQDLTRIRRLETVRQDFVSNVSHELRTPMAVIKSLAETLEEGALEDPPAARRFLHLMQQEIDSMSQLVQEFLELSRIESGKAKVEKKPVSVDDVIRLAVGRMQNQAERAGLKLSYDVNPEINTIKMDSERIQQVLLNLVHNAIKFTPPGGEVRVKAEPIPGLIEISVSDTGVGIADIDLPRIFERFYKSDRARSGGGTGLGLSIARHLIEAHGGEIRADSLPGEGSTFSFTIPIE